MFWKVTYELSHWDYQFKCQYGLGRVDVRMTQSYDLMSNPVDEMIESLMDEPLKTIAMTFERRQRVSCPNCNSSLEKLEDKKYEWRCRHCAFVDSYKKKEEEK